MAPSAQPVVNSCCRTRGTRQSTPPPHDTATGLWYAEAMAYTINIEKADRVAVLQALYNAAKPQGLGHMQFTPAPLSRIEAERLLELEEDGTPKWPYFDYVNGRVMKVGLHGANVQARLYDEDNGEDAAWTACKDIEGCARVETEPVA